MLVISNYKPMNNLNPINFLYLIIISYIPFVLRGYGQFYIENFWLGLSANVVSLVLIFSTYIILSSNLKKDKSKDMNITTLIFSIFSIFIVLYTSIGLFTDNVVFVGGKYFSFAIYSYLIYSFLFLQFLVIFVLRFYNLIKNK